jgi:Skp family chaperone for outer membrane proteins
MRRAGLSWGAIALLLSLAAAAQAQSTLPSPAIVVVDMMQIMRDSKAAKNVQAQVQDEMNAYTKEVSKREEDLKRLSDQLERQRTALAPEVFATKSQEYQQRYTALDHDVQTKRQAMQQSYSEAMTKVETMALQIVADVARERKANMVVAKAALLYMADGIDVTAEVTGRLDEKLPSLAVNLPKEGGEAAKPQGKK